MKKIVLMFIVILLFFFWSCSKDKIYTDITQYKWEVIKIREAHYCSYESTSKIYILEFTGSNEFILSLDVNTCTGTYKMQNEDEIEFNSLGCTEICCDSYFAGTLSGLFPEMSDYYATKDELYLSGKGEIILRKSDE